MHVHVHVHVHVRVRVHVHVHVHVRVHVHVHVHARVNPGRALPSFAKAKRNCRAEVKTTTRLLKQSAT